MCSLTEKNAEDEETEDSEQPRNEECECKREYGYQNGKLSSRKLDEKALGDDAVPFGIAAHETAELIVGHLDDQILAGTGKSK